MELICLSSVYWKGREIRASVWRDGIAALKDGIKMSRVFNDSQLDISYQSFSNEILILNFYYSLEHTGEWRLVILLCAAILCSGSSFINFYIVWFRKSGQVLSQHFCGSKLSVCWPPGGLKRDLPTGFRSNKNWFKTRLHLLADI